MKSKILYLIGIAFCLTACGNRGNILPSISGKAGEVLCVIEKADWEGAIGQSLQDNLAGEYPYLPIAEPNYTLVNVSHEGFINMFQVHRNIIYFDINPQIQRAGVTIVRDKWASPQIIVNIAAHTSEEAKSLLEDNKTLITTSIEQAERDRIVRNTIRYENAEVSSKVEPVFGGSVKVPSGYNLRKLTRNFAWIEYSTKNASQGIFIYRYPVTGNDLTVEKIIANRNAMLKENVPGPDEGTYMITAQYWTPTTEYLKYKGREFAQTHGQWEVEGAFMGGPFVSHCFYSPDGKYIVAAEGWVFAPKLNKRQLFRQVESLLYTWQWKTEE